MISLFNQLSQTSVAQTQEQAPVNQEKPGTGNSSVGAGYSSCIIA
uniref:Mating factor a3.2 n=1 Tax=Ustanciosporium gigantosporum TaxID=1134041 RepID=H2CZ63_9BASI|nr:mating factor a3.2 [Ustanciosporium gigantosporum]